MWRIFAKKQPKICPCITRFLQSIGKLYLPVPGMGQHEKEPCMKKLGIVTALLAAGVVAASGVFAQELKFDGYVNTGIGILLTDANDDVKVVPFGVDSEQAGYRFRLNGSYTSEEGNAGAKFRLQAQSKFTNGALSIPYVYGWASFFNKVLTVTGGLVDDSAWASGGAILNDDVGEGLGALIKASPISGLNLGAGVYLITPQGGSDNNVLIVPVGKTQTSVGDFSKIAISPDRLKYTFNAGYTMPELFKLTLTFRTANQAGDAISEYADADSEVFNQKTGETSKLIFGAQVLAIKNLTAVLEAEVDNLQSAGTKKDEIDFNLYETLGYKLGNLAFGLNAAQYIVLDKVDHDLGVQLNPWVSYALGSIVPRLDLTYFLAGTATTALAVFDPDPDKIKAATMGIKYHRKVFAYADTGDADNVSVIAIRPSVKFNVGKSFVEIGDLIAYGMGPDGAFALADDPTRSSTFDNVFYVDFKWSF
jgi:hypothetical protein